MGDQPPSRARQTLQISIGFLEPSPQQRRGQESQQKQPRRKTRFEENPSPATKSSCRQSQESRRRIRCSNPIRIYHLNCGFGSCSKSSNKNFFDLEISLKKCSC